LAVFLGGYCFGGAIFRDTHPNGLSKTLPAAVPVLFEQDQHLQEIPPAEASANTSQKNVFCQTSSPHGFGVLRTVGSSCGYQQLLKIKKVDPSALHLVLFRESQGEIQCSPDATGWRFGTDFFFPTLGPPQKIQAGCRDTLGANNGGPPLFLVASLRG